MNTSDLVWFKSSRSSGNGQCCLCARLTGGMAVRDSKNPAGGTLIFTSTSWKTFIQAARRGSFD